MAKGVSGALTRLAKISAVAPLRAGSGLPQQSARSRASIDEDEEAFYLPDDLEDLAARHYVRRRTEPKPERSATTVTVAPMPAVPLAGSVGTARASAAVAAPAPAGFGVAESGRPGGRSETRRATRREVSDDYRTESSRFDDEERQEPESVSRASGRVAERIRRIKTALAAKIGREPGPEAAPTPVRSLGGGRSEDRAGSREASFEDESEPGHTLRGSWRAKQLARVRRRLGMTQAEFARCFGLSTDDVIRWEAGARPARAERVLLTLIMHDPEEMARLVDEALALK